MRASLDESAIVKYSSILIAGGAFMTKDIAANLLQTMICDAICSEDPIIAENAKRWLLLDKSPTFEEIVDPMPGSFIAVCKVLDLKWHVLNESLLLATEIDVNAKPQLRLVH